MLFVYCEDPNFVISVTYKIQFRSKVNSMKMTRRQELKRPLNAVALPQWSRQIHDSGGDWSECGSNISVIFHVLSIL